MAGHFGVYHPLVSTDLFDFRFGIVHEVQWLGRDDADLNFAYQSTDDCIPKLHIDKPTSNPGQTAIDQLEAEIKAQADALLDARESRHICIGEEWSRWPRQMLSNVYTHIKARQNPPLVWQWLGAYAWRSTDSPNDLLCDGIISNPYKNGFVNHGTFNDPFGENLERIEALYPDKPKIMVIWATKPQGGWVDTPQSQEAWRNYDSAQDLIDAEWSQHVPWAFEHGWDVVAYTAAKDQNHHQFMQDPNPEVAEVRRRLLRLSEGYERMVNLGE